MKALRNRNQSSTASTAAVAAASAVAAPRQHEAQSKKQQKQQQKQQQQQSKVPAAAVAFYRKLCEAVQSERGNAEEMVNWALATYATLLKNLDKSLLVPVSSAAREKELEKQRASAEAARLEKYRSRGLSYSVRHISPAIQRRQRADRGQSKDLATLIDELKQHRDMWETFLGNFKESLGSGLNAEQKEAVVTKNDDTLYEIYKSVWPLLEKLNSAAGKFDNDK